MRRLPALGEDIFDLSKVSVALSFFKEVFFEYLLYNVLQAALASRLEAANTTAAVAAVYYNR